MAPASGFRCASRVWPAASVVAVVRKMANASFARRWIVAIRCAASAAATAWARRGHCSLHVAASPVPSRPSWRWSASWVVTSIVPLPPVAPKKVFAAAMTRFAWRQKMPTAKKRQRAPVKARALQSMVVALSAARKRSTASALVVAPCGPLLQTAKPRRHVWQAAMPIALRRVRARALEPVH